jgi:hypothetical protein
MLCVLMRPRGSFKIRRPATSGSSGVDPSFGETRCRKIVDSLCSEILESENLRIRQIFEEPRAIYRIELDRPDMSYQRTTLLDEDTLEELLEIDEVRSLVARALR